MNNEFEPRKKLDLYSRLDRLNIPTKLITVTYKENISLHHLFKFI